MYEKDFTVEYVDVDSNNKLSNYGIFKYLQEMGCLHADACKCGINDVERISACWILLDWKLHVFYRPSWNTHFHIKTWLSKIDQVSCYRDFEITGIGGEKIAVATSRWVLVDIHSGHITKITQDIVEAFGITNSSLCEERIEKIIEPEVYENTFKYTILKRDIDTNKHLNNLNYILLASEMLPDNTYYSRIDVMYKKQCFLNDTIVFKSHMENDECIVSVKSLDEKILHAIIKFRK